MYLYSDVILHVEFGGLCRRCETETLFAFRALWDVLFRGARDMRML